MPASAPWPVSLPPATAVPAARPDPLLARQTQESRPHGQSTGASPDARPSLRRAFDDFVGQTFYGQLLKSMRTSLGKPPYFHGGRGEEVFQAQLDQVMVEKMSDATAETLTGPMFELFMLGRQ
jgi:hypothetical protein